MEPEDLVTLARNKAKKSNKKWAEDIISRPFFYDSFYYITDNTATIAFTAFERGVPVVEEFTPDKAP